MYVDLIPPLLWAHAPRVDLCRGQVDDRGQEIVPRLRQTSLVERMDVLRKTTLETSGEDVMRHTDIIRFVLDDEDITRLCSLVNASSLYWRRHSITISIDQLP